MYDAQDKTDRNKDAMKKITLLQIPQLNEEVSQCQELIQDKAFLEMQETEVGLDKVIQRLNEIDLQFKSIDVAKGRAQEY